MASTRDAPERRGRAVLSAVAAGCLLLTGCGAGADDGAAGPPSPSATPTLPRPASPSLSGRLTAELRQTTHDRARGQMEVWLHNGTGREVTPTRIVYRDPRLGRPVAAERLRPVPSGFDRGFTLPFPRAVCPPRGRAAPLEVTYGGEVHRLPVDDPIGVVATHAGRECLLREVTRIAGIRFADRVAVDGEGTGHLVLLVEPAGRTDAAVAVGQVNGSHLLGHPTEPFWSPRVRVSGTGDPVRIRLPVAPARCDPHAFQEGGGATTFLVHLRVAGRAGKVSLPMSTAGSRAVLDWAADVCGFDG